MHGQAILRSQDSQDVITEADAREETDDVRPMPDQSNREAVAECGSKFCDGCYSVGDGRKIHPPKGHRFMTREQEMEQWKQKKKPKKERTSGRQKQGAL
jgi:hypothetical protein